MAQIPKYRQIADALREKIVQGELRPGDDVPGENALMSEHHVARETARRALAILNAEGLTESLRGYKTVVRNFKPIIRVETARSAEAQWGAGRSMWENDLDGQELATDKMHVDRVTAPDRIARVLGASDAILRSRRYLVDGRPSLLADSYLPFDVAGGTRIAQANTGPGGTYARLKDLGLSPAFFSMQVWSRPPQGEEKKLLKLPANAWVLAAERTAFTEAGRVVEVNEMTLNPTMYVLQFDYSA